MDIGCPIPRGPYHSLTPLQPSERNPFPWEEAPEKPELASQEAGVLSWSAPAQQTA
jgi:hypothetical protein